MFHRPSFRHVLTVSTSLFFCAGVAQAQEASPGTGDEQIVVLGGGLPLPPATPAYGSQLIVRERLEREPSGRVDNALAHIAGFQQFRRSDSRSANPSAQGVTLRALGGNASSRALLLLDGVPQADPFFGYIPFNALVPERPGAIRVTRGGGIGAFGAGAVAGTIEMVSADRSQLSLVDASALIGSRDAQELSASLSPDVGMGFVTVSGRWERGDGFYTTPRDQRVAASVPARYRDWSTSLRGVAPVGEDGEIQARIGIFRDNRTLRFAGADSSSEGQDASIRYLSRGRWQVDALAYVQSRNFTNIVISSSSYNPVLNQRDTPATGIGGKLELRPPVGEDHVLRIGADARHASGTMLEDAISGSTGAVTARRRAHGRQMTTGFFVEDDWTLGDLILTAGARADYWTITDGSFVEHDASGAITQRNDFPKRDGWEGSFRAGTLWRATGILSLRVAGYTGFRLPTLNELYRGFTVFPVRTDPNADLKPERLKGAEAGLDLTSAAGVRLSATAFYNRLDNAIANVTIATNLRERQNVDRIVAKGVELSGDIALGQVHLTASWAYSDSKVHAAGDLDGQVPAQSPRHMASVGLEWEPVRGGGIGARLRYVGPQYEDDLGDNHMPGAVTVDGYVQWPLARGISLIGRIENLFDERVVTRLDGNGGIDLGVPRSLWFGLKFSG